MRNLPDPNRATGAKRFPRTFGRESSNANEPLRPQGLDDSPQMFVAERQQFGPFPSRKFVGCEVPSAFLHKRQRTVVGHKMVCKEVSRMRKTP